VRFADAKRGWAIGHLGVVLRTDDGGEHWVKQLDGIAIGRLAHAGTDVPPDEAKRLADDGPDKPLLDLLVQDAQRVTVVGAYNLALTTDDGGQTWRLVSQRFDNPERLHLYGIASTSSGVVAVGEQGLVLRQQGDVRKSAPSAGPVSQPAPRAGSSSPAEPDLLETAKRPYDGSFFGLAVIDDSLLAFGLRGNAFFSHDGGTTWRASKLPGSGASINASLRLADGRLLLADQAGGVFVSNDAGEQFERVPFAWGAPITSLAEAADGAVVVASLGGIARMPRPGIAPAAHAASHPAFGGAK
jgi:photosystem II stability/assembly factor-like uncharacterized protein